MQEMHHDAWSAQGIDRAARRRAPSCYHRTPNHERCDAKFVSRRCYRRCRRRRPAQGQVNVICSVQAEWCNMISTVRAHHGPRVNVTMKGSGEALAQLIAEKENPKTDVWFGGTGDPHLQAAEQGLTIEDKSPSMPQLHDGRNSRPGSPASRPWASTPARSASATTRAVAKKKLPARDLSATSSEEYKGEVQVANPASSGVAYR